MSGGGVETTTTVEWRVESETTEDEFGTDEQGARRWVAYCNKNPDWEPVVLMRREVTVTTTPWTRATAPAEAEAGGS